MLGMIKQFLHSMKRKVIDKMDDFLCYMTCEEFYSDDCLTEEEKRAILDEIASEENQTTEEKDR
jgi:hypothetical protein